MNKYAISAEHVAYQKRISVPNSPRAVAAMIKERLQAVFNARLRGVVLYGSEAREALSAATRIRSAVLQLHPELTHFGMDP